MKWLHEIHNEQVYALWRSALTIILAPLLAARLVQASGVTMEMYLLDGDQMSVSLCCDHQRAHITDSETQRIVHNKRWPRYTPSRIGSFQGTRK